MLSFFAIVSAMHIAASNPIVKIMGTVYEGNARTALGVEVEEYLGIRYARAGRFQPPRLELPLPFFFKRRVSAQTLGDGCPATNQLFVNRTIPTSEDCLVLNVWRTASQKKKWFFNRERLPVMVSIHGGTYLDGSSQNFDGAQIVAGSEEPMILVTMNYRQNAFGFLGSDNLRCRDGTTGNWGLQDQRMAIKWVRYFIRFFGGDSRRITLHGQSAGGGSVASHLITPKSRGLVKQAILESTFFATKTMTESESQYAALLNATQCANADCLRSVPTEQLADAAFALAQTQGWAPTVDGVELTKLQWESFEAGEFDTSVRVMAGTTSDEAGAAMLNFPDVTDPAVFGGVLASRVTDPALLPQLLQLYNSSRELPAIRGFFTDLAWQISSALSDQIFFCPTRRTVRWLAQFSTEPVHYYVTAHPIKSRTLFFIGNPNQVFVPHGGTIPLFWNCARFPDLWDCTFDEAFEATLALEMSRMYSRFVTTGQPGGAWMSPYSLNTDQVFSMGTPQEVGGPGFEFRNQLHKEVCDFWDTQIAVFD